MIRALAAPLLAAAAVLAGCSSPEPDPAAALDIDCATESAGPAVTEVICADPQLAALNDRLAETYRLARQRPDTEGLAAAQRGWTAQRNDCAQRPGVPAAVTDCLREAYRTRLAEVAITDPAVAPDAAAVFDRCRGSDEEPVSPLEVAFYNDLDPAVVVLTWQGDREVAFIEPAASGSRYTRTGVQYWEHHGEAAVDFYGNAFRCLTR
ncbi:MliC family protein [Mycobacterium koreense]|uniref:Uncharacterized protein n=1 Tax=Mycolicibacillus koreensis TaxID=1069220 RepID=A0A7I7SCH7_9MYCO|nr:MliC family protein [Mycolicibacillus koreensis]MCV7248878.1 MliC family protein [Mycolicibacillus koreensis]OSC36015.1 hypothetical protein B8W67_00505 [Mycolicibacillus koreensis]BBY53725.1 lipoprotein LprI [Mycolicibacillus koreensis]